MPSARGGANAHAISGESLGRLSCDILIRPLYPWGRAQVKVPPVFRIIQVRPMPVVRDTLWDAVLVTRYGPFTFAVTVARRPEANRLYRRRSSCVPGRFWPFIVKPQ